MCIRDRKLSGDKQVAVYQIQYLYTTTAAYMTGLNPALLIWCYITLSGVLIVLMYMVVKPSTLVQSNIIDDSINRITQPNESNEIAVQVYRQGLKTLLTQLFVELILISAALGINYCFVRLVYFEKPYSLTTIQFGFALIKQIFSSVIVPFSSYLIQRSSRPIYSVIMTIIINIVAPGVAILMASPLCLYYHIKPSTITDTYSYYERFDDGSGNGYNEVTVEQTVVTPKWFYSYQCSSSFLTSYLPTIVYLYMFSGVILPLADFMVMILYSWKYSVYIEVVKTYMRSAVTLSLIHISEPTRPY